MKSEKRTPLLVTLVTLMLSLVAWLVFESIGPLLYWNRSASLPIGWYRVVSERPTYGAIAVIRLSLKWQQLAEMRGYLKAGEPLIKRLVALPGDWVCIRKHQLLIPSHVSFKRKQQDKWGRALPFVSLCRALNSNEFLVATKHPDSFDSRYFGVVKRSQIIAVVRKLWS